MIRILVPAILQIYESEDRAEIIGRIWLEAFFPKRAALACLVFLQISAGLEYGLFLGLAN